MKKLFVFILVFVLISNLPPIKWINGADDCCYSNEDGMFTYQEAGFKGDNFRECINKFLEFKRRNLGDTILYRLCPKNPLHFWRYGDYLFAEKYRLPYRSWKEIEAKRKPVVNKTGFQDF